MKVYFMLFFLFLYQLNDAQIITNQIVFSAKEDSLTLKDLKAEFGTNKKYPLEFELPILKALSHYPELKHSKLKFKYRKVRNGCLEAFFTTGVFFRKPKNRQYTIKINRTKNSALEKAYLHNIDYNEQIGVLGHELAHITQYNSMSTIKSFGLISLLFSKKAKTNLESGADLITIEHQLGHQLYLRRLDSEIKYPHKKRSRYYLTKEDIKQKINLMHSK